MPQSPLCLQALGQPDLERDQGGGRQRPGPGPGQGEGRYCGQPVRQVKPEAAGGYEKVQEYSDGASKNEVIICILVQYNFISMMVEMIVLMTVWICHPCPWLHVQKCHTQNWAQNTHKVIRCCCKQIL